MKRFPKGTSAGIGEQFSMRAWREYCCTHIQVRLDDQQKPRMDRLLAIGVEQDQRTKGAIEKAWRTLHASYRPLFLRLRDEGATLETWQEGLSEIVDAILAPVVQIEPLEFYIKGMKTLGAAQGVLSALPDNVERSVLSWHKSWRMAEESLMNALRDLQSFTEYKAANPDPIRKKENANARRNKVVRRVIACVGRYCPEPSTKSIPVRLLERKPRVKHYTAIAVLVKAAYHGEFSPITASMVGYLASRRI